MTNYLSKDGWQMISHNEMNWDEQCKAFPSERIKEGNGVYLQKCFIAYSHRETKTVFFVDGMNGDSYGQFKTLDEALKQFHFMASLDKNEQRKHDR